MSIFKPVFDEVVEADIRQLLSDGQVEGMRVEFKRDMYGGSDADKKEFLKDMSAFANSAGGQLVIGIDEAEGVASALSPIEGDQDANLQRLEQIARAAIEPRIVGVQMRAVPIASGGCVYLIRVPRSWNPPHRVTYQGTNRFFLRSSAGAHEASVEELRAIFANGATMHDRMESYVRERLAMIRNGDGVVPLAEGDGVKGKLIIHIMPFASFTGDVQIDVREARDISDLLQPLGTSGNPQVNFDGFMVVRNGEVAHGYTQVFRNGIIEATKVRITAQVSESLWRIPTRSFAEMIYQRVPSYIRALSALGVSPPFAVSITLAGVQDTILGLATSQWGFDDQRPIDRAVLTLPTQVIADTGTDHDYRRALAPAFDALFNAVGMDDAQSLLGNFDINGEWIGH